MTEIFQIAEVFIIPWHQWALAFFAAFVLGFSKAGIKGLGVVIVMLDYYLEATLQPTLEDFEL